MISTFIAFMMISWATVAFFCISATLCISQEALDEANEA